VIKFQLLRHYNISTDAWLTTPNVVLDVVVYSSKVSVSNLVCHINIKETFSSVCHLSQQYFFFPIMMSGTPCNGYPRSMYNSRCTWSWETWAFWNVLHSDPFLPYMKPAMQRT